MKPLKYKPGEASGNRVSIEVVPGKDLAIVGQPTLKPLGAHRVSNGSWTVPCRASMTLQLEDGRNIEVFATVALKGKQFGRKPRRVKP